MPKSLKLLVNTDASHSIKSSPKEQQKRVSSAGSSQHALTASKYRSSHLGGESKWHWSRQLCNLEDSTNSIG